MLISITNSCNMNCTHCMGDYKPCDEHMTMEKFDEVITFIQQYRPLFTIISGGEPTLNPNFIPMMQKLKKVLTIKGQFGVASNGMFLEDKKLTQEIIDLDIPVQITNDERYYPIRIKKVQHPNFTYIDKIDTMYPQGRAHNELPVGCKVPKCFNAKLISYQTFVPKFSAIFREFNRRMKFCFPMVDFNGDVYIGESRLCTKIGTIYDSDEKLFKGVQGLKCKKCNMANHTTEKFTMLLNAAEHLTRMNAEV